MYMLDTNTCIYILKNRPDSVRKKFKAIKSLCISSVTYGELCYGIENGLAELREQRWQQLEDFTRKLFVSPWDVQSARYYGAIRSSLKNHGKMIGNNDLLIASHARSLDAVLVTNNKKEFSRVEDLSLEDWS